MPPRVRVHLVVLALAAACAADQPPSATGTVTEEPFVSSLVDGEYLLRVRLPPDVSADDDVALPLVVQLDPTFVGLEQYAWTTGLVSTHEADGDWPEAVVVGIDYGPDPGAGNGRLRDYTPTEPLSDTFDGEGADRFFQVLRDELLPYLDETLPVDPTRRTLVGHSNGGVFGWYATLRHDEGVPPLFSGVVAADAGIDQSLFTLERWHAERATDLPVRMYASHALYNGAGQDITFNGLVDRLEERGFGSFALRTERLDTDHGGAVAPSFENGLDFVLSEVE